ncbi:MAG: hypothetical protein IPK83_06425 [Planctomycetes bacterium]|nr:hypothetical protein [Planctomycetota bacterium]
MKRKHQREIELDDTLDEGSRPAKLSRPSILHEDADFFVVSKPVGIFFRGGLFDDPSISEFLAAEYEIDEESFETVYPLDPDISGLMVVARNESTRDRLIAQFDSREMSVTYLALIRGMVMTDRGSLEKAVTLPKSGRVKVVAEHGAPARTDWRIRDSFIGFALLECTPRTRHEQQIRAHLHDAGMPLAVDVQHGGAESLKLSSFKGGYRHSRRHPERPLISRPTIHASKVEFKHPNSGKEIAVECPPPKDFKATLYQLDRFGRIGK